MYCHSKYENRAPGILCTLRVALERACHHCETIGLFQIELLWADTQIMLMLKWAMSLFWRKRRKKNLKSFLSSCCNNSRKKKEVYHSTDPREKDRRGHVLSHREIQPQRDLACDLLPVRVVWLFIIGPDHFSSSKSVQQKAVSYCYHLFWSMEPSW